MKIEQDDIGFVHFYANGQEVEAPHFSRYGFSR